MSVASFVFPSAVLLRGLQEVGRTNRSQCFGEISLWIERKRTARSFSVPLSLCPSVPLSLCPSVPLYLSTVERIPESWIPNIR